MLTSTVSRLRSAPTVTVPPAGEYRIVVEQQVELPKEWKSPAAYRTEQRMRVTGPHFGLDAEDVLAVYPPAQADGEFSDTLCHVILRDPSLPWRIALDPHAADSDSADTGAEADELTGIAEKDEWPEIARQGDAVRQQVNAAKNKLATAKRNIASGAPS